MFFLRSKMLVSWFCFRTCWFLSTKQKIAATSPTAALVTTSETFTLPSAVPGSMTKSPHAFHHNYMLPRGAHQNPLKPCGPWHPPHASLQRRTVRRAFRASESKFCGKNIMFGALAIEPKHSELCPPRKLTLQRQEKWRKSGTELQCRPWCGVTAWQRLKFHQISSYIACAGGGAPISVWEV